jgi:hypothetical protein
MRAVGFCCILFGRPQIGVEATQEEGKMKKNEAGQRRQAISRRQALGWTARGGAALAGAALLGRMEGQAETVSAQSALGIAGSWMITATDDGAQGPPNSFLATFTNGGGYIQSSSPGESTGHGSWIQNADGSIGLTFWQQFYQPMSQDMPPAIFTAVAAFQNTFSGRYRYNVTLADGSPLPAGAGGPPSSRTGMAVGTRIAVRVL